MKPVHFHPDAESEMIAAATWYESQQVGLGSRFLASIQDSINRINLNSELYPEVDGDVRRCMVKTFPFGVFFRVRIEAIQIVAVSHLRREPGYWRSRSGS
jgi:hypothetical protein